MKLRLRKANSGIALLIVMCAIFVLSILAAGMAFSMRVESTLAMRSDSSQQLIWLGRSGVQFERWMLAQELQLQPDQSLNQIWAGGTGSPAETNSVLAGIDPKHVRIGDGWVSIHAVDLERYANINTASGQEIQQALTLMGVDAGEISVISDSIQDWVQPGDMPRVAGAKNGYYLGLNPPYNCKEAPMDDLSELLLVKGIRNNPAIYWGGAVTNHPGPVFQHQLGFGNAGEAPNYPFGLKDLFTPFSDGRVNINTAGKNVLQMLLMTAGEDVNSAGSSADDIIKYRAGPDGAEGDADDVIFTSVQQLTAAGVNPAVVGRLGGLADVHSTTFKITITAHLGRYSRDFDAILYCAPGSHNIQVVRFYWTN